MYLLSFSWQAQRALWEIFETGTVQLLPLEEEDITPIKNLMEKYRDLPMDLADAALVRVAEREGLRQVLTLDQRDFNVYSLPRKGRFTLLP
jgi:predicted nucleic acid-binding protein